MDKKKAIAAGHICLDITPAFKSKEEKSIKDLFRPGQLIAMDAAKVSLGGSVSNTGIGMKRLGADVELIHNAGQQCALCRFFVVHLRTLLSKIRFRKYAICVAADGGNARHPWVSVYSIFTMYGSNIAPSKTIRNRFR